MNIGQLDRRIVIQVVSGTQDAVTGEWKESWSTYATVWAGKMSKAGKEKMQGNQVITTGDEVFIVRHDPSLTYTPAMRISYGGDTFEITSITELKRKESLQIIAQRLK